MLDLERAPYPHLVEIHVIRCGGTDYHPGHFTIGCELLQLHQRSWLKDANRTTSSAKSKDASLRFPIQTPSSHGLNIKILFTTNGIGDSWQSWWSPT